MTFRAKLLLISVLTVSGAVALVTGVVSVRTRHTFEGIDQLRQAALLDQFQRELAAQGEDLERRLQRVAASDNVARMEAEAARPEPDLARFVYEAQSLAESSGLDYLDIAGENSVIVSSAHWPARFGYPNEWGAGAKAALTRVAAPDGFVVGLACARPAGKRLRVLAARRVDASFLSLLGHAPGQRALLWFSPNEVIDANGPVAQPQLLNTLVERARTAGARTAGTVQWDRDRASAEAFLVLPLQRDGQWLGALLAGTSLRDQVRLEQSILWTGVVVGGSGILLGVLLGWWSSERVSRPVEKLAAGARAVAAGDWSARVDVTSHDEIGDLARAFNQMTAELVQQRDRAIQAERVAAWRELARRLAHELKNPLFPLQITVENLQRARDQHADQFDEVFRESTSTLLAELANLKIIVGRFSDFAKMPPPQFERIDLNELVRGVAKLFEAQCKPELELSADDVHLDADPDQVARALRNLVLNALDAMPAGGTVRIRTERLGATARLQVSDAGEGLTTEECERLFTPYYTTKRHGTGLGLAIVQSVVSDHRGAISVASTPGRGSTFTIDLPIERIA